MIRMRTLAARSSMAIAPIAAAASLATQAEAQIALDVSTVAEYSNSGWLMQDFNDSDADGAPNAGGFALTGSRTRTDGMFWRYDDYYEYTVPRSDITGFGFVWTGSILNTATTYDDSMSISYDVMVEFEHTPAGMYDSPTVNIEVLLGWSYDPYTPSEYGSVYVNYSSTDYQSISEAGLASVSNMFSVNFEDSDASTAKYWVAFVAVNFSHEYAASWSWTPGNYAKLDGDSLTASPSLDLDFNIAAVPEPSHYAGATGVLALGVAFLRRRLGRARA